MFDCQIMHPPRHTCPKCSTRRSRTVSARLQDFKPQTGPSMARGKCPPLISHASICSSHSGNNTIPRGLPQKVPLPACPIWGLYGETGLALCHAGSSRQASRYVVIRYVRQASFCDCRFPCFASVLFGFCLAAGLCSFSLVLSYTAFVSVFRTGSRLGR